MSGITIATLLSTAAVGAEAKKKQEAPLGDLQKQLEAYVASLDRTTDEITNYQEAIRNPSLARFTDKGKKLEFDTDSFARLQKMSAGGFPLKGNMEGVAKQTAGEMVEYFNSTVLNGIPEAKRSFLTIGAAPQGKEPGSEANPVDIAKLPKGIVREGKYSVSLYNDGKTEFVVLPTDSRSEGGLPKLVLKDDGLGKTSAQYFYYTDPRTGDKKMGIWVEVEEQVTGEDGKSKTDKNYVAILDRTNATTIGLKKDGGKYSKDSAEFLVKPPIPAAKKAE